MWGYMKDTGVPVAHLKELCEKLFDISSIKAHPQIKKIFDLRKKSIETGEIDMGTAESMAFSTLLTEGYGVRLSG